jgi:hypothetical protein
VWYSIIMPGRPPKLSIVARRLLSAIQEIGKAIHDQKEAITVAVTETTKAANEKQSVPPLVHAEVNLLNGVEIHKSTADETDEKNYRSRTLLISWLTFAVAFLTLVSLIIYAVISNRQLHEMRRTTNAAICAANAATKQADLMQRDLEGTAAFLNTKIEFNGFNQPEEHLTVDLPNTGHLIARDIRADLKVTIRKIPGEETFKVLPDFTFSEPELNIVQETSSVKSHQYFLTLSEKDWQLMRETKETIRVEGPLNYFNGFHEVLSPICSSILYSEVRDNTGALRSTYGPTWVHCDEFPTQLDAALKWKKEHDGKKYPN